MRSDERLLHNMLHTGTRYFTIEMGEENVLRPELPINNIAGNSSWK
jgi:hypothetical protein